MAAAAPSELARAARSRSSSSPSPSSSPSSSSSSSSKLWAHPLSRPERGCVLVAHPLLFTSTQTYFSKSVVFLIEHDDGEDAAAAGIDDGGGEGRGAGGGGGERRVRGGTAGLILNKATTITLGDVGGGVAPLLPTFGSSTLHLGGDVERSSLHVVHGVPGLPGSIEVVSGVRVGGVDAAAEAVREGRASAGDFKFLHGYVFFFFFFFFSPTTTTQNFFWLTFFSNPNTQPQLLWLGSGAAGAGIQERGVVRRGCELGGSAQGRGAGSGGLFSVVAVVVVVVAAVAVVLFLLFSFSSFLEEASAADAPLGGRRDVARCPGADGGRARRDEQGAAERGAAAAASSFGRRERRRVPLKWEF